MKRAWFALCALLGVWACSAEPVPLEPPAAAVPDAGASSEAEPQAAAEGEARRRFGQLPMRYEENRGQHHARARYVARQGALTLFATDEGPVLALRVPAPSSLDEAEAPADALGPTGAVRGPALDDGTELDGTEITDEPARSRVHGLRLVLEGARAGATIEPSELLITRSNYFIGDNPSQWHTDLPNYGALTYRDLAPGVDLVLRGSPEGRVEYDFVVAPGTSPELVMRFDGAERVRLGERGALEVHVGGIMLEQPAPVLYQEVDGRRVVVEGAYHVVGLDRVQFEVGEYDGSLPLVIDPVLVYATYLGGSGFDTATGIAVDGTGAAYLAGVTSSPNFPTASPLQSAIRGGQNAFVAKLTPAGTALAYATYLGGSGFDGASGIAVDGTGAAYLTGHTSSANFPTASPLQSANAGGGDAFVAKLTPAGTALAYATYLGGSLSDSAEAIAVDGTGAAYVTGYTSSTNFPTASPLQSANAGSTDASDAFVAKLTPAGTALAYATYLGGSDFDQAYGIAVDGTGAAYVTGYTVSPNFPTASPLQSANAGQGDVFVVKLTPAGAALTYATYLGGSRDDAGTGIAVDGTGAAYVTGQTSSTNLPTASPLQSANAGDYDAFVAKLTPAGTALAYATYLGGGGNDLVIGIAVDGIGAVYLTGYTSSTNFPTASALQSANAGGTDAFVAKLTPAGTALAYATYLGGSGYDVVTGIAVDGTGAAYVTGYTRSTNFPTASALQSANAGGEDAFVAKLGPHGAINGASCSADTECASGLCTDGVCCNARCAGGTTDCQACSTAAGAVANGTCGPSTANTCDDGLGCTSGTTCSIGTCADGSSPCVSMTSCSEASGGTYTCSACAAGTFSADGTGATACTPCAADSWSAPAATHCAAWAECSTTQYESTTATATSDRVCSALTVCSATQYESTAPTSTRDRICSPLTVCSATQYASSVPTSSSDRVCSPLTVCGAGEFESVPPTATSDRVCAAVRPCGAEEYEVSPPTATSDRVCALYTECAAGEYQSVAPTATSDRVCTVCAVCGAGEVEASACSMTADTVCALAIDGGAPDGGGAPIDDGGLQADAGGARDAGTGTDGGPAPEPALSGCGCAVPGSSGGARGHHSLALFVVLGFALARRRRRRP